MSRKGGKMRMPGRMPGGMGGKGMMEQLQKLQEQMLEAQEQLGNETVTVTAGGGAVTVVMTGHQKLESITISPDVLDDVEMVQDLIVAAVNEAVDRSQQMAAQRMSAFTGGLGIPGLM